MKNRLFIFAGYDKKGIISDSLLYYLKKLSEVGDIIFYMDNDSSVSEIKKLKNIHNILFAELKRHGEYDFGSYKRGYEYAKKNKLLEKYDDLIFCNDSVFGPFYSLKDIIEKMNRKKCDFWGMYKHINEKRFLCSNHIQSYFMYFHKNVFMSDIFDNFVCNIKKEKYKKDIVIKYEIGFSVILNEAGYSSCGYFEGSNFAPMANTALDIFQQGFPFLKKSLFDIKYFYNKSFCVNIYKYKTILSNVCPSYPINYIEDYLIQTHGKKEYEKYLKLLKYRYDIWYKIIKIFYMNRVSSSNKRIIKILKIPVWNKEIK